MSFALLPGFSPALHHLGLGLLFPSPLASTFPWTLQRGGGGERLLVDPPRAILPGWQTIFPRPRGFWPLLLALPRMFQSGASARHVFIDFRVVGALGPAA